MADKETIMGAITDKLFGNNIPDEVKNPRYGTFTTPGATTDIVNDHLTFGRSAGVDETLSGISDAYSTQADELGGLQRLVQPGFGRLTKSAIRAVRDARRSSMGDLRQNLARRRVRGSSFGADDISRTASEFSKREDEATAQAFVRELGLSNEIVNQKATAKANSFLQTLSQFNLETQLAAQISNGVTGVLGNNAQLMSNLTNSGANRLLNVVGTGVGGFLALSNPFGGGKSGSPIG